MRSQITMEQLRAVYDARDVFLSDDDAEITLEQCNDQADQRYHNTYTGETSPVRSALQWAEYFADGEAYQQECEAREYAQFHHDAYGDD